MSDPALQSLSEAARALTQGTLTSRQLVEACLARVASWQPRLNAFIALEADAVRAAADASDRARISGAKLGPLAGIPLAHKDMFFRKGKVATCGSKIRREWVADVDSTALKRLADAGALQLGTLNMAEFAFGPTGHNWHFGHCRNPWDQARVTGGSSSGSGASVAAGLAFGALGSDTGGSIRLPATFCGLTGMKGTYGLVSRHGAMPLSFSFDHIGPLARTVEDCALLTRIIAGADPDDPTTSSRAVPDYVAACARDVRGLRIGLPKRFFADKIGASGAAFDAALAQFRAMGLTLVDVDLPDIDPMVAYGLIATSAEAAGTHIEWLRTRPQDYSEQVRMRLSTGLGVGAVAYLEALRHRARAFEEFSKVFAQCDALVSLVYPDPAPSIAATDLGGQPEATAVLAGFSRLSRPANYLGIPALTLPIGFAGGLPVGAQLMGPAWSEETLFALGAAYQRATDWHQHRPV